MKRRSFLGLLGAAVAVPFAKAEAMLASRPLVKFGLKGEFVRQTANRNSVLTPEVVAKEALRILENDVYVSRLFAGVETHSGGDTIKINRPADFRVIA